METDDLTAALRRMSVETGSLVCLGCGHEHGCSVHGCAVLKEAADRIERSCRGGRTHRKPVIAVAPDGRWIRYASIKDAAQAVGVKPAQISTACVTGQRCAGYLWDKEEDSSWHQTIRSPRDLGCTI